MEVRDWMIIIFTFFVGMLCGAYFYVTAYNPIYNEGVGKENIGATEGEYSIVGEWYGGMVANYVHPSFRVVAGGTFIFFPGGDERGAREEGELPTSLKRMLESAIASTDIAFLATPVDDKSCISYVDGTEYVYTIETETGEYQLDTCRTVFSNDTDLGEVLLRVWEYVETGMNTEAAEIDFSIRNMPRQSSDASERRGLSGYIEDAFDSAGFGDGN